jgi:triosephosphate isomerase
MRKKILAANWKMNLLHNEAINLITTFSNEKELNDKSIDVIIFPPSLYIQELAKKSSFRIGAQNFYFEENGAFTGEISIPQLKSICASSLLIGHSERRQLFKEDNQLLKNKVDAAIMHNIYFIFCCGESLEIRDANTHIDFVVNQLKESLFHLSADEIQKCAIAYEPIWAIGTGKTASTAQAQEVHAFIRCIIANKYGKEVADQITIQYGGSVKPENAAELFSAPDIDGALIGGAALQSRSFTDIVKAME